MGLNRKKMRNLISRVHGNSKMKTLMNIYKTATADERSRMEFHLLEAEMKRKEAAHAKTK